jgi:hypothetical protein
MRAPVPGRARLLDDTVSQVNAPRVEVRRTDLIDAALLNVWQD